jgi:aminoglycoside phosphotransferase (APT) family kinase protein
MTAVVAREGIVRLVLMSRLQGIGIRDVFWSLSSRGRYTLIEDLAQALKQIHSITFDRAGFITDKGIDNPYGYTVRDFALGKLENSLRALVDRRCITTPEADDIMGEIARSVAFRGTRNSLLHNDLGLRGNNVLVHRMSSGVRVSGIVDFERSRSGDPLEEIARVYLEFSKSFISDVVVSNRKITYRRLRELTDEISGYMLPFARCYGGELEHSLLEPYMLYVGSVIGIEALRR